VTLPCKTGSLLQAGAIARGEPSWAEQSDDALLAQGRASGAAGASFARLLPSIPGLNDLLTHPGAALLDVGTGVAAMAVACAQALPGVRVVGIDVLPRAIELAAATISSGAASRERRHAGQWAPESPGPSTNQCLAAARVAICCA